MQASTVGRDDILSHVRRIWVEAASTESLFPLEKEIVLYFFKLRAVVPGEGPGPVSVTAARLLSAIITLHRRDATGRITSGRISSLGELRKRLQEEWYEQFYRSFYARPWIGGVATLFANGSPALFDKKIDRFKHKLAMATDMLEFMLRVAKQDPRLATREAATEFVSLNGFRRENNYGVTVGEKKKERAKTRPIARITVSKEWQNAPATLGLSFIIATQLPELDRLKLNDTNFLEQISNIARDDKAILRILAQYHWLLDFVRTNYHKLGFWDAWPSLPNFSDREQLPIQPLTDEQSNVASRCLQR